MSVKKDLVIFLDAYIKEKYNNSQKNRKIERIFSMAAKEYINGLKETNQYENLKNNYGSSLSRLEKVAEESVNLEGREETKKFIEELVRGEYNEIYKKLKPYLIAYRNTSKSRNKNRKFKL